ncbi:MAG: aspartate/glutamate racemase family protein [Bacteroidia bacterium]
MKKLGLIGGTSWVSTMDYYRFINEGVNKRLGGLNFSQCIIYSFNYADIVRNNEENNWALTLKMITDACKGLQACGAEGIVLCANTMHLIADDLKKNISLPVIHIAEATGAAIKKKGLKKVALLGTKFTMEREFYTGKLKEQNIEAIIPTAEDRQFIHDSIFGELGSGILTTATKDRYMSIISTLISQGAEGVILGCTEIPLLIKQDDVSVPVFDTAEIHAEAAVKFSLGPA